MPLSREQYLSNAVSLDLSGSFSVQKHRSKFRIIVLADCVGRC